MHRSPQLHGSVGNVVHVAIGSENPSKVGAVRRAFELTFHDHDIEVDAMDVPGAPTQPMSDHETMSGAEFRLEHVRRRSPQADYWVGIEGGIERISGHFMVFAWAIVCDVDSVGRSRSANFELPQAAAQRVDICSELGGLTRAALGERSTRVGLVGILSEERITRESLYIQPVMLALMRLLPAWSATEHAFHTA
jgi:inosine/xanthosine triphosphatase